MSRVHPAHTALEATELTPQEENDLKELLSSELTELEAILAESSEAIATVDLEQPIGRLSRMDALQQQKMAQEQRRRHELRRAQVKQALGWLEEGDYGQD